LKSKKNDTYHLICSPTNNEKEKEKTKIIYLYELIFHIFSIPDAVVSRQSMKDTP